MGKGRLEAFSDGVIAIIITIMVLELKVPHGAELASLVPVLPVLGGYVLSFIYVGIYWNNHHHLLHIAARVSGGVLWANLHLLFWLSLLPFATNWMGEEHFAILPVVLYGAVLLAAAMAYYILTRSLIACNGRDSALARAIGADWKGMASVVCYLTAILLAFASPWASLAVYALVAMVWLVPDQRIEKRMQKE